MSSAQRLSIVPAPWQVIAAEPVGVGPSRSELARLLDVTPETVSHWETGKAPPNRAAFIAVCAMIEDALDGRTTTRDRLGVLAERSGYPRALAVKLG